MTLKLTFLGSGSAFTTGANNYQSNMLLEKNGSNLLFDAGGDVRHSLYEINKSYLDIQNIYISHLHNDHIGGMEWLALSTKFDSKYSGKPNLFISETLTNDLWQHSLRGGLRTIQMQLANLDTYFTVREVPKDMPFYWESIEFHLVQTVHIVSGFELVPCYGLFFKYNKKQIFITSDTQYAPSQLFDYYRKADIIFHDCETAPVHSRVHAHYSELLKIPDELKQKIWLYHYNPGPLPDATADGFKGFVKKGQVFDF